LAANYYSVWKRVGEKAQKALGLGRAKDRSVSTGMPADRYLPDQIIPASVERLIEMSSMMETLANKSDVSEGLKRCQACSTERKLDDLSRCKGCESVSYCDKVRTIKQLVAT
jgi:hypothetical protein